MFRKCKLLAAFLLTLAMIITGVPLSGSLKIAQASTISLSSQSFTLETGHYKTLYVYGTYRTPVWSSSNKSVASVSSGGRVTAQSAGTATIYAYVAGKTLSCKVTVIAISRKTLTLAAKTSKTLQVTGTLNTVTWSSGNSAVAAVSSGGKVTAKTAGTTTIYAKVSGKTLTCSVTVIAISSKSLSLNIGASKTIIVSGTSGTVTWSTSNSSVAAVTTGGKVTAKAAGTAAVTAAVAGIKLTCTVTVTGPVTTVTAPTPSLVPTVTPTPAPKPSVTPSLTPSLVITPAPAPAPIISSSPAASPVPSAGPASKIVGYYAAWAAYSGFTPDMIKAGELTHINYAFANIGSDLKITLGYPDVDPDNISKLNNLKLKYPNLKTIISVGGWSWSGRFSDAALTDASRTAFADSCVDFIVNYGFDGIDIDWEYPVSGGLLTNVRRPEDKQDFTLLMQTLRQKLDERGAIDGKKYILSFAGATGNWYIDNTELSNISRYVDYANVMTYDIHGPWEPYTNFNAPLYNTAAAASDDVSAASSINEWLNAGFPKDKIVMGVPFYGYIYKSVADVNNGLYQTYSGAASISYANVASNYLNAPGFVRYYQPDSMVPWLFDGSTFITYEDAASMAYKAQYIKNTGLNGAMIWELSQDPDYILLDSLYKGIFN